MCPELIELDLISNPVCYLHNYRNEVKNFVPNLVLLDGIPINGVNNEGSSEVGNTSSEFSSISDQTRSDNSNNEIVPMNHQLKRPSSFGNISTSENKTIRINRPSSTGLFIEFVFVYSRNKNQFIDPMKPSTSTNLSSGEPVCGNVISRLRFNRRNKRAAWVACDSSSTSSGSESISAKDFPEIIPQMSFDLELGVLGMAGCDRDANRLTEDDDHTKLLLAAKKWRKKCQKTLSDCEQD